MLHELLLALAGFPGNVFRPFPPAPLQPTTLALADDFPMMHPGERETLHRLAGLGFQFMTMNKFIEACRSSHHINTTKATSHKTGLYRKAMAIALERRLQGYRRVLIETERSILSGEDNLGGSIPLSTLAARFSEYQLVFPVICDLLSTLDQAEEMLAETVAEVEQETDGDGAVGGRRRKSRSEDPSRTRSPYYGARLIDLLQDKAASGVPIVQEWLNDMLSSCCSVMMRQIVAWVIYGQVQDPFGEWFIVSCTSKTDSTPSLASPAGLRNDISSSTASLLQDQSEGRAERSDNINTHLPGVRRWQAEYKLDESLVPKMIPTLLATEILFIGKAIATARDARTKSAPVPDAMTRRHLEWIMPLVQSLSQRPSNSPAETSFGGRPPPSPPMSPMEGLSAAPSSIPTATTTSTTAFPIRPLKQVVHAIRKDIVEHLWVNVRVGRTMAAALRSFQRYFLLADGEFGLGLIDAIDEFKRAKLLKKHGARAAPTIRDQDLSGILFKAAKGTTPGAQEDEGPLSLQQFELRVAKPGESSQSFDDQLLGIPTRLHYRLMWPLDLLLTADDMRQYSDVFAFLITVRKAQVQLQRAWTHVKVLSQMGRRRRQRLQRAAIKRRAVMKNRGGSAPIDDGSGMTDQERLQREQEVAQEEEVVRLVSTMRSSMMFVVDGLWSYLQMDVLGPTFNGLIQSVAPDQATSSASRSSSYGGTTTHRSASPSSTFDFDVIYATHAETIHEIQSACLITSNELVGTLKMMLQAVESFSGIVARRAGDGEDGFRIGISADQDELAWQDWADLSSAHKTFREQTQQLFAALSTASKSGTLEDGPVLRRSVSGMGSSFLVGNGPKSAVIRQLDRLLLRLEYAKAMWFQPVSSQAERGEAEV
ncbi:Gamma-tubulin complex component 4 [Actinomortierella ambigua]|uniref:Spindle pole body component n=1 Tax=Actinomortierella ambigua TaxID=1343610 RepID=A0A9P6TZZ3_9FUNG|nr:Gamma-tubulin complex component 4 [Actinomortierella ambigua]